MFKKIESLSEIQKSTLKEVGNIGTGHASIALSQLTGKKIIISETKIRILDIDKIIKEIGKKTSILCVKLEYSGDLAGLILLILDEKNAQKIVDLLLKQEIGKTKKLGDLEWSAIKETGSILSAAYLNALNEFIKISLFPSTPEATLDNAEKVILNIFDKTFKKNDFNFVIENELEEHLNKITGKLMFLTNKDGIDLIINSFKF